MQNIVAIANKGENLGTIKLICSRADQAVGTANDPGNAGVAIAPGDGTCIRDGAAIPTGCNNHIVAVA